MARRFETYGASTRRAARRSDRRSSAWTGRRPHRAGRAPPRSTSSPSPATASRSRSSSGCSPRWRRAKGRKSLILVSEGFIYDPNLDEFKDAVQASRAVQRRHLLPRHRAAWRACPPTSPPSSGPPSTPRTSAPPSSRTCEEAEGAESLAADSGGFSVKNTNDLGKGIQRIADESRSYYLLGYNPTNTARDGRFRKIQVKVPARKDVAGPRPQGLLRAPRGGKSAAEPSAGTADPAIQAALDSPVRHEEASPCA